MSPPPPSLCKQHSKKDTPVWIRNDLHYSHNAAISLGRSAPNWPKRWLLARRSKGEWLRMELKAKGYMARENLVM